MTEKVKIKSLKNEKNQNKPLMNEKNKFWVIFSCLLTIEKDKFNVSLNLTQKVELIQNEMGFISFKIIILS